jgi:hypothetical protein
MALQDIDSVNLPIIQDSISVSTKNAIIYGRTIFDLYTIGTNTWVSAMGASQSSTQSVPRSQIVSGLLMYKNTSASVYRNDYDFMRLPIDNYIGVTEVIIRQPYSPSSTISDANIQYLQMFYEGTDISTASDNTLRTEMQAGYTTNLIDHIVITKYTSNDGMLDIYLNTNGVAYFNGNTAGYADFLFRLNGTISTGIPDRSSYYMSTNLYSFIESKDPYYILNF